MYYFTYFISESLRAERREYEYEYESHLSLSLSLSLSPCQLSMCRRMQACKIAKKTPLTLFHLVATALALPLLKGRAAPAPLHLQIQ